MTCIAGFVENGTVWMGADSAGVGGDDGLTVRADRKLFRNGPMHAHRVYYVVSHGPDPSIRAQGTGP